MGREISLIFILKKNIYIYIYIYFIDKFLSVNTIEEVFNEDQDWRGGVNGLWPRDGITSRWNWKSITLLACSTADLILIIPLYLFFPLNKDFSNLINEMKNWMGFALSFCPLIFILVIKLKNLALSNSWVKSTKPRNKTVKEKMRLLFLINRMRKWVIGWETRWW